MEVRSYKPQSKKLDPKTISGYFIGYCVGSRGSMFYCPLQTTRVIESYQVIYFEDDIGTSQGPREIVFKEHLVFIPVPINIAPISSLIVDQHPIATAGNGPITNVDPITPDVVMDITLRRSKRARRPAISDDYNVYLQEREYNVGDV